MKPITRSTFLSMNILVNFNLLTKIVDVMDLFDEIGKKKQIYRLYVLPNQDRTSFDILFNLVFLYSIQN